MNWYEKLNEYFTEEEMKSKKHIELLLKEKKDIYHKDEGPDHVLMYAEFRSFIFIDYLWVSAKSRGKGIGHQLLKKLKEKNKPIILEVEPVNYNDSDTEKRLRFYQREQFEHAQSIGYNRRSLSTNKDVPMEILYWTPGEETEDEIFKQMQKIYEDIHTYRDVEIYGKEYHPVDEVLSFNPNIGADNLMDELRQGE